MKWWLENNHRLIQTNIRETDANLDVQKLVGQLKELSANVLMLNTGGIAAFYPTNLPYQTRSPYLEGDLIGEVVRLCHENDIRFIARFDFSKVNESILKKKPEWLYRSKNGEYIHHEGLVSTCLNGGYQQEYLYEILGEVIERYPVDGIFFNMFGYTTSDYSGHDYGICHCENCKRRFREMYGSDLPQSNDSTDLIYQNYLEFQKITVREILLHINTFVKKKNSSIAISTYAEYGVDMVRKESNTELRRSLPFWLYSASENVKSLQDSWEDKVVSNCSINAAGIDYRFMGVSKNQIAIRLYECIASGSALDFCIIGTFEGYPDRGNIETVKGIYTFHKENEVYFGHFSSAANVALMKPERFKDKEQEMEYLGIFKMLKENHIQFDVIKQETLNHANKLLQNTKVLLIPDVRGFEKEDLDMLSTLHNNGMNILASGLSFSENSNSESFLHEVFGVTYSIKDVKLRGAYLETQDKALFTSFTNRDWVILDGGFSYMKFEKGVEKVLPLLSQGIYGPPEKCGGNQRTAFFGAGIKTKGEACSCFIPWSAGRLYYQYGYEDHKNIFLNLLVKTSKFTPLLQTNAPTSVEIFLNHYRNKNGDDKNYILQFLNLSGFNGLTFFEPLEMQDITVKLSRIAAPTKVFSLTNNAFQVETCGNDFIITIPRLSQYEAIIIEY